jgi:hypothetical protein
LDGVDVTSQVVKSNYVDVSTHGTYTQSVRFFPNQPTQSWRRSRTPSVTATRTPQLHGAGVYCRGSH